MPKLSPKSKTEKTSEMPKLAIAPDVKAELFRRRADTGLPIWKIADALLRQELGLKPRPAAA